MDAIEFKQRVDERYGEILLKEKEGQELLILYPHVKEALRLAPEWRESTAKQRKIGGAISAAIQQLMGEFMIGWLRDHFPNPIDGMCNDRASGEVEKSRVRLPEFTGIRITAGYHVGYMLHNIEVPFELSVNIAYYEWQNNNTIFRWMKEWKEQMWKTFIAFTDKEKLRINLCEGE